MCGIVGIMRFDGEPVAEELLRTMADRLAAPRPGRRRLLDRGLGRLRTPPAVDHRRRRVGAADGHPRRAAAPVLQRRDPQLPASCARELSYPFRTDGDTETLLAAARRAAAGRRRRGCAASSRTPCTTGDSGDLLLVRDRLGILPLYYYIDAQRDRVRLGDQGAAAGPARAARRSTRPASTTTWRCARCPRPTRCSPGSTSCRPGTGCGSARPGSRGCDRYWSIPPSPASRPTRSARSTRSGEALEQAVCARRMVADVPLGRLPVRRSRLQPDRRDHEQAARRRRAAHLRRRVRRPALRRAAARPRVSELLGTRHHEVIVSADDFSRPVADAVLAPGRTASPSPRTSRCSGWPSWPASTSRWCCPARAATSCSPATRSTGWRPSSRWPGGSRPALRVPLVDAVQRVAAAAGGRARIALRTLTGATEAGADRAPGSPRSPSRSGGALVGRWARHRADRGADRAATSCGACSPPTAPPGCPTTCSNAATGCRWPPRSSCGRRSWTTAWSSWRSRCRRTVKVRGGATKWVVKQVARRYLPDEHRRPAARSASRCRWTLVPRRPAGHGVGPAGPPRTRWPARCWTGATVRDLLNRHRSGIANEQARLWPLLSLEVWHRTFFRRRPAESGAAGQPGRRPGRPEPVRGGAGRPARARGGGGVLR